MKQSFRYTALRFTICYIAYVSIYIARLNLSMASPGLISGGVFTASQIGILGSVFSAVYACGRLANGTVSDKVVPWVMICTGLLSVGASNLLCGFFPPFLTMALLWGVNAYGQSMLWSSELCVVCSLYEPGLAKRRTSFLVTAVAVGNILGIVAGSWIVSRFGTAWAFRLPGLLNLAMSLPVFAAIRRVPLNTGMKKEHIPMLRLLGLVDVRRMLAPAFLHGVMKDNISLWMAVYFVDTFAIDLEKSSWFLLLIPTVGLVGRLLYGTALRLCRNRENTVSVWGFAVCAAASLLLAVRIASPVLAALCLSFTYAAVSVINTSILSIYPLRFAETGNVASVSGLMDFGTYLGAAAGSAIYGFVIEQWGYGSMFFSWMAISLLSIAVIVLGSARERRVQNT